MSTSVDFLSEFITVLVKMKYSDIQTKRMFFKITMLCTLVQSTYCKLEDYSPFDPKKQDFIWGDALNVMSYHRDKMNEYLCKNYIANEILDSFRNQSNIGAQSRENKPVESIALARDSLLDDPGSEKYKNWLSRSSTLEDIYRQFENSEGQEKTHFDTDGDHEGDVTGYALLGHKHVHSKPYEYGGVDNHFLGTHLSSHSHEYYDEEEDEHDEKGLKLKELFHFALTAIAFLAFATFMIEVIMCLMETSETTDPDYVLVPTTTGGTGPASKLDMEEPETSRQERFLNFDLIPLDTLNEISRRVLTSIEGFALLKEDNGECLRRALCKGSKYTRTLPGMQKIWLPIWSFGASWVGGRMSRMENLKGVGAMDYLKATVLGLGSQDCSKLYPKCDENLRRRRKAAKKK